MEKRVLTAVVVATAIAIACSEQSDTRTGGPAPGQKSNDPPLISADESLRDPSILTKLTNLLDEIDALSKLTEHGPALAKLTEAEVLLAALEKSQLHDKTSLLGLGFRLHRQRADMAFSMAKQDADYDRRNRFTPRGVTMQNYLSLNIGMSYKDAAALLGSGIEMSRSSVGNIGTVLYGWTGDNGHGRMTAMFQNDELVSRSQSGLR